MFPFFETSENDKVEQQINAWLQQKNSAWLLTKIKSMVEQNIISFFWFACFFFLRAPRGGGQDHVMRIFEWKFWPGGQSFYSNIWRLIIRLTAATYLDTRICNTAKEEWRCASHRYHASTLHHYNQAQYTSKYNIHTVWLSGTLYISFTPICSKQGGLTDGQSVRKYITTLTCPSVKPPCSLQMRMISSAVSKQLHLQRWGNFETR